MLAACDVGRSAAQAGDELMGLSATFLALGTRHVVASVMPVPDAETVPLMVAFHRRLAAGTPTVPALAAAQSSGSGTGPGRHGGRSAVHQHWDGASEATFHIKGNLRVIGGVQRTITAQR